MILLLDVLLDNPAYESLDDITHYGEEPTADVIEELPLDDIEINLGEDIPLTELGGAGVAAGGVATSGAGVSGAGAGAVITGVAIAAGTIAIGTTVGVLTSKNNEFGEPHKDPVVSLPEHRYIGPGNTVDDIEPYDIDDQISKNHDINYGNANTQDAVKKADDIAIGEFLEDFSNTGNIHSAIGGVGLAGKRLVESVVGVQYPPNLPVSSPPGMSSARERYDVMEARRRRAAAKYKPGADPRKNPDFPKANASTTGVYKNRVRYVWDAWNRARTRQNLPRVGLPSDLAWIGTTNRPPLASGRPESQRPTNDHISFEEWSSRNAGDRGPLIDGFNRQREQQEVRNVANNADFLDNIEEAREVDSDEAMEINNAIEQANNEGNSSPSTEDEPVPSTSADSNMPMNSKRPRADAEVPADAGAGPSLSKGADGGFDSTTGPDFQTFQGGYSCTAGHMTFSKIHEITVEAIPFTKKTSAIIGGGANLTVTPLARIDWDRPYYYLSEEEFNIIPDGSYFKDCRIDIMAVTYPTGYPVGDTTATVSQTGNSKRIMAALDLERKNRGGIDVLVDKLTSTMVPETITTNVSSQEDDFISRQYGSDMSAQTQNDIVVAGCATDIPYRLRKYWAIYEPNFEQAIARKFITTDGGTPPVIDINNSPGQEYFRNYYKSINADAFVWNSQVLNYLIGVPDVAYTFTSAPIGNQFPQMEILTDNITNQAIGSANQNHNFLRNVSGLEPGGNLTITEGVVPSQSAAIPVVKYKGFIEQGATFVKGDFATN